MASVAGTTFGSGSNLSFDTFAGLQMSADNFSIAVFYMSLGNSISFAVSQTGGNLTMGLGIISASNPGACPSGISTNTELSSIDVDTERYGINSGSRLGARQPAKRD